MSKRFLNVGIIQMEVCDDPVENIKRLEEQLDRIMSIYHKPELVVGVETITSGAPDTVPGQLTNYFGSLAKKYGIYFIPGTISEIEPGIPKGREYNTALVFNPKGELIKTYRKLSPWFPEEYMTIPGNEYCVFEMPEKSTKIGIQICYDINFPEISRNLALEGAEVIIKLTMDPEELHRINDSLHTARAVENQCYLVSTNGTGTFEGNHLYGHSMIIDPEGYKLWEAESVPCFATTTLDLDKVSRCREYGSLFMDHYLKHLRDRNFPMPYANRISEAPIYKTLGPSPKNPKEYRQTLEEKFHLIGYDKMEKYNYTDYIGSMKDYLQSKQTEEKQDGNK